MVIWGMGTGSRSVGAATLGKWKELQVGEAAEGLQLEGGVTTGLVQLGDGGGDALDGLAELGFAGGKAEA